VETEKVLITTSAGRILAEDLSAPGDLPPFDNSSMDGFAVRAEDTRGATKDHPARLVIVDDIPAGSTARVAIQAGQAARIMTGAPLPAGADAVVPVEETSFAPLQAEGMGIGGQTVEIYREGGPGANIRSRGSDVQQGQPLLKQGRRLQPQDIGLLASIGRPDAKVYRNPRVAIFSSGDELVRPGEALGPGQIYDSNQFVLAALLEREGAQPVNLRTAPDDPAQIRARLDRAVEESADLIVTSAGVSVGAYDFVRQVIEEHGGLDFWRVNMRPGKPLAFGTYRGIPLIGLPGNPVSAFVGCLVFVVPAVYRLSGRANPAPPLVRVTLEESIDSDGRESYLRAVVTRRGGRLSARLTGHQGSGNIFSLVQANALLIVPSGVKSLPIDSEVDAWYFDKE
jgi:molybdopterin molybdotransferase